ncbi:MAG: DNA gyrase subunit A, partial [Syntrophobacteraceae bacterium]|nr:DNA gyrase subunit A [Syntrophobacteraceae bacterium]
ALNSIDEVVAVIKASKSPQEAATSLCSRFSLTDIQARAILDMRLQRLTGLEQSKIKEEFDALLQEIERLQGILDDPRKVLEVIISELEEILERYGDERRTEIVASSEDINIEDMIAEEEMVVTYSQGGYIKRHPSSLYRTQRRGGRGKVGMMTKEEDVVEKLFIASTHDYILIFTNAGRLYWLKVYQIPQAGRMAKGKPIVNLINLGSGERVAAVLPVRAFEEGQSVIMATQAGIVKKTDLSAYSNPRSGGIIALTIDEGDELVDVKLTSGGQDVFLATRKGKAIRFKEEDIRSMGRTARGVRGIAMDSDDIVIGMDIPREGNAIITVSEKGYGKRTAVSEYRLQSRGGKGTINLRIVPKGGLVAGILQVTGEEDLLLMSNSGKIIRMKIEGVPLIHRTTQGVKLIELDAEEQLVGMTSAERDESHEEEEDIPEGSEQAEPSLSEEDEGE